jgi:hypothetical protein
VRKNIGYVLDAFEQGKAAVGDSKRTCWTSGNVLYSYAMPIAWRHESGAVTVVAYEAGPSRTTRSQIRACEIFFLQSPLLQVARRSLAQRGETETIPAPPLVFAARRAA